MAPPAPEPCRPISSDLLKVVAPVLVAAGVNLSDQSTAVNANRKQEVQLHQTEG